MQKKKKKDFSIVYSTSGQTRTTLHLFLAISLKITLLLGDDRYYLTASADDL